MNFNVADFDNSLEELYGSEPAILEKQKKRYRILKQKHLKRFGQQKLHLFSSPGRTELGGNHTDHNHGKVLAASVNLDSIAVATKNDQAGIILYSEGYEKPFEVNLNNLQIVEAEKGTTQALIRGIAARFTELGYKIGGFNASVTSDILPGSGLSSSASVEVLIGSIFNSLYNGDKIPPETIARIGQYAENKYFGKPCGLMDQIACAVGGVISIDFKDAQNPAVKKIDFDFGQFDYSLLIINTGGSHADLTSEYASIPSEMKTVAKIFGAKTLRAVFFTDFIRKIPDLRQRVGDRAILRALHFFQENKRVEQQVETLQSGNIGKFLNLVRESGNSSFKWLQNIYSTKNVTEQGVTLALALSEKYIDEIGAGACRVHGGGFAGTIQVFLPKNAIENFKERIIPVFGKNSIQELSIRAIGTVRII